MLIPLNKNFTLFFILFSFIFNATISSDKSEEIITNVAEITDNIAELIIESKTEKDPKKIKIIVAAIIKALASIVEIIVEKRKHKKFNRAISLENFNFSDISSKSIDQEIEEILLTIIQKTKDKTETA